jgi:flagellar biogenesis protein FliO
VSPVASYLIETSVTLLGVILIAAVLLYGSRKRGFGRASGPLDLIGRLPLDGQRAVYLVRIGSTVYVIGGSETGLTKMGELSESELGPLPEPARGALADVIRRALGAGGAQSTGTGVEKEHAE